MSVQIQPLGLERRVDLFHAALRRTQDCRQRDGRLLMFRSITCGWMVARLIAADLLILEQVRCM